MRATPTLDYISGTDYYMIFTNNAADTSVEGGGSSHSHGFTGGSHSHDVSASFSGSNHNHDVSASFSGNSMDFRIKYRDVIFASKD